MTKNYLITLSRQENIFRNLLFHCLDELIFPFSIIQSIIEFYCEFVGSVINCRVGNDSIM